MCGRVYVKSTIAELVRRFSFADPGGVLALDNSFPRFNGAPRLLYPIIAMDELAKGTAGFHTAEWGLIPGWMKDADGRPPPINARAETIAAKGLFRRASSATSAMSRTTGRSCST